MDGYLSLHYQPLESAKLDVSFGHACVNAASLKISQPVIYVVASKVADVSKEAQLSSMVVFPNGNTVFGDLLNNDALIQKIVRTKIMVNVELK